MTKFGKVLSGTLVLFSMTVKISTSQENWTLEKCLEYAYQNSPLLKAAGQAVKEAEAQAQASASILYPQLSFNSSYTKNAPAPLGSLGGGAPIGRIRPSFISAQVYEHSLGLNYTIFSWKIKPTLQIASFNVDRSEADCKTTKNELTLQVKSSFYGVLFAKQLVAIRQKAVEVARDNFQTTEKLYKEGKVSHFDVSRAKVRWINSQSDLIEAQNNYDIVLEALRSLLSLPAEEMFLIAGELTEDLIEVDLNQAIEQAHQNRPEIQSLIYIENLTASTVNLEKAARLPSFSLSYNYGWQAIDLYADPDKYFKYWTLLGRISVPIFDGFSAKGKIKAAQASLEQVKESKEQLLDLIELEVKQAFLALQAARERISAQKENVSTAQENLRIATERYKLGLLSQLDLKDAELSLTEAETNYQRALFDYNLSLAELERAQGR